MLSREELLKQYGNVFVESEKPYQVEQEDVEEYSGPVSLPSYCSIPKEMIPLFKTLWNGVTDENIGKISEFLNKFYKTEQVDHQVDQHPTKRPYIPKYNLYEQSENYDLHVERGDERFDRANNLVNILRSKGMASQFGLTLDDLKKYFTEKCDDPAIFNYANTDLWNEEELSDLLRQMCGETEQILLNDEKVFQEVRYYLNEAPKRKVKERTEIQTSEKFKNAYLTYLRAVDYHLCTDGSYGETLPRIVLHPPTKTAISVECYGHLSSFYFIPWKIYRDPAILKKIIFPWIALKKGFSSPEQRDAVLESHRKMYTKEGRIRGLKQLGTENAKSELLAMQIQELEKIFGKKQTFYENEKKRFLEKKSEEEELQTLLEAYVKKQQFREKLIDFTKKITNELSQTTT